jgi:hypothetical protein
MALYTSVCFVKFELVNGGCDIVDDNDISIHVIRALNHIQTMIVERMESNSGGDDTYMSDDIIVEILQIGTGEQAETPDLVRRSLPMKTFNCHHCSA